MFDMQCPKSTEELNRLYERGRAALPGGVSSSTRLNQAWGRPVYASRCLGAKFWDIEGREFLDFSMSHGAALLGHRPGCLKQVFDTAWALGGLCSLDTPFHIQLAEALCDLVPCGERVRFTNSGSYTGRSSRLTVSAKPPTTKKMAKPMNAAAI